ncbi:CUE domain-containing protein [Mycena venus]|uniref:CUE domain-containing protein n=1 Tax=Mycena venus TaxID=2733690 RepID=A0A8H6Z384_9AGAR|nr:CUE domain-containing protein [Mycena venus]
MSAVHPTAQIGFAHGTNELYNKVRAQYQPQVLSHLHKAIKSSDPLNIVEIGSGTGLFTRALLAHDEWKTVRSYKAVDPSEGMRETFAKYTTDERVVLSEGTFANTGAESGWADLIVIAQAFHWCLDHEEAAAEFARVLKPGGVLALIWIHESRDIAPWLEQFRARVERDEGDTPRSRSGAWRQLFNTPSYKKSFTPPEEAAIRYVIPNTLEGIVSRGLSSSRVVVLTDAEKEVFVKDVEAIVRRGEGNDSPSERSAADTLGFRPKPVSQDMIDTISNMFPDIPPDNIRYDLLRTGSVELSSNKILERGFLDPPPPAYFTLYPRDANADQTARAAQAGGGGATSTAVKTQKQSLIDRYNLQERVAQPSTTLIGEDQIGGKAVWEDSPEKREASLKERKAQMILAARQRMLAQQQQKKDAAP